MQLIRIRTYFFIIIGLFTCISANAASTFSVNEQQVNQYLAKQKTISNNLGFPGLFNLDYNLQDITAKIGQNDPNRVELSGIIDSHFKLPNDQFPAKLNLTVDTIPYYDPKKGAIYLKDLRILHLSGLPSQYQTQIQSAMPLLADSISALIGSMPIYTLDETDARQLMIKQFAKGIKVEKGKLSLETTLF
ncbi:MAG TPA: DUF1439 domain-containing protein [Pasteurellaceae bacterium]|nr:DUF1439 domain-containing protein [Pasteurellaceae bacterium]